MLTRSPHLMASALLLAAGFRLVACNAWAGEHATPNVQALGGPLAVEVLVAQTDLPKGTLLNEQDLRWQAWPDDEIPETLLIKGQINQESLYGAAVRRRIVAGEPILEKLIVKSGEPGYVSAALRAGYRAFPIKVTPVSEHRGRVLTGGRVDVILKPKLELRKMGHEASEVVLTSVRVLALDQLVDEHNGQLKGRNMVTLEVTSKQAKILMVVSDLGQLHLRPENQANLFRGPYQQRPIIECATDTVTQDTEQVRLPSPCENIMPGFPGARYSNK